MTTISATVSNERGFTAFIRSHPLTAYFILAYAGMWVVISPLVMDSLGWIALPDALGFLLFFLSSLSGPTLAAYLVTAVLEGKAGMRRLFRRTFQVRAGLQWYAVVLFIFFGIWLAAYSIVYKGAPIAALAANPALLLSAFLPNVIFGLLIPSIGEEPGWRGFALPRMQKQYGPIMASILLGALHGAWHLPALFTPLLGPFTVMGFLTFVLTATAATFIYTWVFNNTRGSVWMVMLLHSASNAASSFIGQLVPKDVEPAGWSVVLGPGWLNVIIFSVAAFVLIVLTRGTLGYRSDQPDY